ncbi:MAG: DNA translocase FtsK 4TM domain-containing protein [Candidatus Krumholzibacteria bacterium]|nr:DNA translocase FtsK 4TM domain-containing protein [Candidatus Krumholzibacteria bacterium]MDP6669587.1 DNA translocase FtsK 4TM domain-containing protein [Candidatus Krumholzibacteria bacterium]MDP6797272.1 DNA translocase FtsK 4TM domain-containing protein [Candidatus Krumholzibacteria bacterium]MDP7020794.1 DNA translocase FtsK 4TM domain-containing protein [Candidatus Krumholzibacteria bacterium]
MKRHLWVRGLVWLLLAVMASGSLYSYHPNDWIGWGLDSGLWTAENSFGFLGAVIAKLMAALLGSRLALLVFPSLFLALAFREFLSLPLKRVLMPWGSLSLLSLLWLASMAGQDRLALSSLHWGGWLGGLLAEGLFSFLGSVGSLVLPLFLTFLAALLLIPSPWLTFLGKGKTPLLALRSFFSSLFSKRPSLAHFRSIFSFLSSRASAFRESIDERFLEEEEAPPPRQKTMPAAEQARAPRPRKKKPQTKKPATPKPAASPSPRHRDSSFEMPAVDLLKPPEIRDKQENRKEMESRARVLTEKLATFQVGGKVSSMSRGPVVSTFEFEPEAGVKVNQIVSRREDLALALRSKELRLVAPIPGKAAVGIELPNDSPGIIRLREVLDAREYEGERGNLDLALGVDVDGVPFWADLSTAPHLLVAGATGTGKSVCINTILVSLLLQHSPETLRLFLVDPKMLELSVYNDIPHLLHPVITDNKMALQALNWLVGEMERRYRMLKPAGVRSIVEYNEKVTEGLVQDRDGNTVEDILPFVVCVVEEFADLMMTLGKDVQMPIVRLAQMARAVGIHMILATQRPSVDIIDGVIKANFPSRIAFKVFSRFDSKTILDMNGAEALIGRGDMLFMHGRLPYPRRLHGAFIETDEVEAIVEHWRQYKLPEPELELSPQAGSLEDFTAQDELYEDAKKIVVLQGFGSTTMLQRRLRVGYTRASRLMDMLEDSGIVGPHTGSKAREVLVGPECLEEEVEA